MRRWATALDQTRPAGSHHSWDHVKRKKSCHINPSILAERRYEALLRYHTLLRSQHHNVPSSPGLPSRTTTGTVPPPFTAAFPCHRDEPFRSAPFSTPLAHWDARQGGGGLGGWFGTEDIFFSGLCPPRRWGGNRGLDQASNSSDGPKVAHHLLH